MYVVHIHNFILNKKSRKSENIICHILLFALKCYDKYEHKLQETKAQFDASCAPLEISY